MKRLAACSLPVVLAFALLGCGDGLSLFTDSKAQDLSIVGPDDGAMLTGAQPVTVMIGAPDPETHPDLEVRVSILAATGEGVWDHQLPGPVVNEDLSVQLPELPPGQYRLEIVVLESGEQVERRVTTIFSVGERPRIAGIASFPPLITASSPVLLTADLAAGGNADPWLRWTWRGKTIAEGTASSGAASVLWKAPADEGVYTVTLELFPFAPPAGTGFSFRSSVVMSTDIYVGAAGAAARDELDPASAYLSLFHLRADLVDAAAAARDLPRSAEAVGSPSVVPVGDGFGYRIGGGSGLHAPWPILPVADGTLEPFTLSVGLRPEKLTGADRFLSATAGDLALALRLGSGASPELAVVLPGVPETVVPSTAPSLEPGRRYLLSVSIEPRADGLSVRWFVDGRQVSQSLAAVALPATLSGGSATVDGPAGFSAVVDELGVFYRDEAGRPATDPGLLRRALRQEQGDRLLLAEGFDGMYLPPGVAVTGKAALGGGKLALSPEASVELPPISAAAGGFTLDIVLGDDAGRGADISVAWAGSSEPAFADGRVIPSAGVLRLEFASDGVTVSTPDGVRRWQVPPAPAQKAGLVVKVGAPRDARSPLAIAQVVALAAGAKE